MSIPKTTISMTGVNQQQETEIKVKVTSVIIEPCSFNITCFCLPAQNTFPPAGKGGEVYGRQRDYYPHAISHSILKH